MNIGIYETEHFEGAYPVIRLFDYHRNAITIYTNQAAFTQFQFLFGESMSRYTWIVMSREESKFQFILRVRKHIKEQKIELLYLNTISDNFIFFGLLIRALRQKRVICTLHDINTWFEYRHKWSVRRWVRHIGKRMLINMLHEFNVVSLPMVGYLQGRLPAGKMVHCIPGAFYDPVTLKKQTLEHTEKIRIVIPGTIDRKRRNYSTVFNLIDTLRDMSVPFQITLLGGYTGSYGLQVIDRCRAYASQHNDLFFYHEPVVPQPEFDRIMDECHFVWIPSVIHTAIVDDVEETYGVSKSSGNLFDVIKHAKPFMVPRNLQVDEYLETSCFRYNDEHELAGFIKNICADPKKYDALQKIAQNNSEEYTLEKIRARNSSLFNGTVEE